MCIRGDEDKMMGKKAIAIIRQCFLLFIRFLPFWLLCLSLDLGWSFQITNPERQAESKLRILSRSLALYHLDHHVYPVPHPNPPYGLQSLVLPTRYLEYDSFPLPVDYFAHPQKIVQRFNYKSVISLLIIFMVWFMWLLSSLVFVFFAKGSFRVGLKIVIAVLISIPLIIRILNPGLPGRVLYDLKRLVYPDYYAFDDIPLAFIQGDQYSYFYSVTQDGFAYLASRGPDFDFEVTESITALSNFQLRQKVVTFNPSNGLTSSGDIWVILPPQPKDYPEGELEGLRGLLYQPHPLSKDEF